MNFKSYIYGDKEADTILLQMVDEHELDGIDREIASIRELSPDKDFCLLALKVNQWNHDLSPWTAQAVFGKEGFAGKADETLHFLLKEILPILPGILEQEDGSQKDKPKEDKPQEDNPGKKLIIGGYSLAGLFSLWAAYQTDCFDGVAAASPSIWYPHFIDYMRSNTIHARTVYLSLGDREERTRNAVMATVGNAVRSAEEILKNAGVDCTLEWNQGNHFKDADLRTARAFAWVLNRT